MAFGRISYVVLSVLTFVDISTKAEIFQLIRGERDRFSRPKCLSTSSNDCCRNLSAECLINTNCRWCKCGQNKNNYKPGENGNSGRCVNDRAIVPESVQHQNIFRIALARNKKNICVTSDAKGGNGLELKACNQNTLEMKWIWTTQSQLLNIEKLECMTRDGNSKKTKMTRCSLPKSGQPTWLCSNVKKEQKFNLKFGGIFLGILRERSMFYAIFRKKILWKNYLQPQAKTCTKTEYKGCYRFADGSFLQFMSKSTCDDANSCFTNEITAPIYIENQKCSLNWRESKYIGSNGGWQSVKHTKYVTVPVSKDNKLKLKIEPKAFEVWNGLIVRLEINCKETSGKSFEQHCVLLKFETLQNTSSTSTPRSSKGTTATTTSDPTDKLSSPGLQFPTDTTGTATKSSGKPIPPEQLWSSTQQYPTDSTSTTTESPGALDQSTEPGPDKTVAVSVTIVLLGLILLLVAGFLMFRRRRTRSLQRKSNGQGIQSQELQNSGTTIYTDPLPPMGPTQTDKNGTGNQVYESIDELELASPGNEYSYASNNDVTRPTSGRSLPLTTSTGGEYASLEESENGNSSQTGMYQPLGDRRQEYVLGDYQELVGTQVKNGHGYTPESAYPKEIPNNPVSNDNEYSYARNDNKISVAKMSPSLSPSNSNNTVYSVLDDPESSEEQKTGPHYATLDESNTQ